MQINRTYKYRLYPTKQQKELIEKHFGCCRFVYNFFLNERKNAYLQNKMNLTYYIMAKKLTSLKKDVNYAWLNEVICQSLQQTLRELDITYNKFLRKQIKFPKFKCKKDNKNSFCVPQKIKVINDKLYIPKFRDGLKFKKHRDFNGEIYSVTISKNKKEEFFVSIGVKEEYYPEKITHKHIGIDVGLKDLVVTSDGVKYNNPKFLDKLQKKINLSS